MKIEHHLEKKRRFEKTMGKLDKEEDYETLIEDYMLASAHLINAAMHSLKTVPQDKDIKHNQLSGTLARERSLGERSGEVASLIQALDQLRPSHVYGKGENGATCDKAKECFEKIKNICEGLLK